MNSQDKPKNFGTVLVLLSALMFGSYGLWSKLIGPSMGNFYQGWTRSLLILVFLVPLGFVRKEIVAIKKEDRFWFIVFLVFTSLTQAPIFYAFNHMNIGTASLLFFVSMFLTMNIIGVVFFKEQLTKIKFASIFIALCGMYFVFSFSLTSFAFFAAAMAIVNGIASGGEVAFSKKLTNNYSSLYIIITSWAIILPTNLIFSLILKEPQIIPAFSYPWLWQVCYTFVALLAFWLVVVGFKYLDAGIGALLGLLEIVFSVIFGILIFKESLTISVGVGGVLIILAAALPHVQNMFQNKSTSAA